MWNQDLRMTTFTSVLSELLLEGDGRWSLAGLTLASCLFTGVASAQCQTWSQEFHLGVGPTVLAMKAFDDGSGPALWVGGDLVAPGPWISNDVARWNGHNWVYTEPLDDEVTAFGVFDDGTGPSMYAGGFFDLGGLTRGIARWDGMHWVSLGGDGLFGGQFVWVNAMATFDAGLGSELYIGGNFQGGGATNSYALVRWNGTAWLPLGTGLGPASSPTVVNALQVFDDGTGPALYVGGVFSTAGGRAVNDVAKWDGSHWSALGTGADGPAGVYAFAVFDDGSGPALYASGSFQTAGSNIAKWNGTSWVGVVNAFGMAPAVLQAFDDGLGPALFVAGNDYTPPQVRIAKWNGNDWKTLGGGVNDQVNCLAPFDAGSGHGPDMFVGGNFTEAGGRNTSYAISRWISCTNPIEPMCFGDNSLAICPCSNAGAPGHGCNNSIGSGGAILSATGQTSPDTLALTSSGELPTALSIVLQGTDTTQFVQAFGDGLRCIGGHLLRLFVKNAQNGSVTAPSAGDPSISVRAAQLGDVIASGSVRYYQVYYRDPNASFCPSPAGSTFNVSNGMRVVW
jgi:hypothetical protein